MKFKNNLNKKSPTKVGAKENEVLITYTMFMLSYYFIAFITSDLTNWAKSDSFEDAIQEILTLPSSFASVMSIFRPPT